MRNFRTSLLYTAAVMVVSIVVGTVFRFEIERHWDQTVLPVLIGEIGEWTAVVSEYMFGFTGGVVLTLIVFAAFDLLLTSKRSRRDGIGVADAEFGDEQGRRLQTPEPLEIANPNWREVYKSRDHLRLYEAAHLLADAPPEHPIRNPTANAFFESLKLALCMDEIRFDFGDPPPVVTLMASLSGQGTYKGWKEDRITQKTIVKRTDLIRYLRKKKDTVSVSRLGG